MFPNRVAALCSRPVWTGLTLAATLVLTACSTASNTAAPTSTASSAEPAAARSKGVQSIARLASTKGSQVTGTLQFFPLAEGGVRVHIHEKGDCSSGDGLSAGGHFNPAQQAHGKFGDSKAHHLGDLPSLDADTQGVATIDFVSKNLTLDRGSNGILGRSLIVHNDPDDYTTQPTGNSGARLACAVIERGA